MIFPIGDEQVKGGFKPIFSYLLIGINVIIFLFQFSMPQAQLQSFIYQYGSIPAELANGEDYYTIFSSMFLHGGWMHLIGNLLFLWIFADNIEATIGNIPFLIFYLVGGVAAAALHTVFNLGSNVPAVGASGAISAVLGAYLVMFPKSKIKVLVIYFFRAFTMSALVFLGLWIGQQLISGFFSLGPESAHTSGVAWWAHIGGFAFGVICGFLFRGLLRRSVPDSPMEHI